MAFRLNREAATSSGWRIGMMWHTRNSDFSSALTQNGRILENRGSLSTIKSASPYSPSSNFDASSRYFGKRGLRSQSLSMERQSSHEAPDSDRIRSLSSMIFSDSKKPRGLSGMV